MAPGGRGCDAIEARTTSPKVQFQIIVQYYRTYRGREEGGRRLRASILLPSSDNHNVDEEEDIALLTIGSCLKKAVAFKI